MSYEKEWLKEWKIEEDRIWKIEHEEYLHSDKWKAIRLKVLKRDNHLCQVCLDYPATEVHHLNYINWKNELMTDLLSVCRDCHKNRMHKCTK
jgi:5-methylcytosine-specific restriction endonuclease McrA